LKDQDFDYDKVVVQEYNENAMMPSPFAKSQVVHNLTFIGSHSPSLSYAHQIEKSVEELRGSEYIECSIKHVIHKTKDSS
jgi:hypothetical protein